MYKTVLVPIDISENELTQRVVAHVEALAKLHDTYVHFLTVIPSYPYYTTLGVTYPPGLPDIEEMKRNTSAAFIEVIKRFNLPEDRIMPHIMTGTPKEQILKLADSLDADLIIIGSHRPSATTFLLGSNAAAVVRHTTCSVLVVRYP
ncbi:universal stress protein UspF [Candidatus Symbiopectobacterium sp. 'North America']|uniref:universal stress protein UspF n=1 Tax=Candidatus Symbiopectobacterium sp. 'North America' TaxID=2794574 RepID=UPI0018CBD8F1|nr:universal stress protein UspF [Candidatus Symbiopectobacterium sp. 'North America']MBG6245290.1 universal stress protein UspF [Candidatus Symbiopectobacterium sp. 'North America']